MVSFKDSLKEPGQDKIYDQTVRRSAAILQSLYVDGDIDSPSGIAGPLLQERIGMEKLGNGHFRGYLRNLQRVGFIICDFGTRRTYSIKLRGEYRANGLPKDIRDFLPVATPAGTPAGTMAPATLVQESLEEVNPTAFVEDESEADVLGARPGRLAARIEKSIPEIVANAVNDAIDSRISLMLGGLGYSQGVSEEAAESAGDAIDVLKQQVSDLEAAQARLVQVTQQLNEELTHSRAETDAARTEYNKLMLKGAEGQVANTKGLSAHEVHSSMRDMAAWAIANGFTIQRTRGGHLRWQHKSGKGTFSPTTPSDQYAGVRNVRAVLERIVQEAQ